VCFIQCTRTCNISQYLFQLNYLGKGTVQRKLRGFESGINQQVVLYYLAADILFLNLGGHHPLNAIKPVSTD
jgi:hypothetical protein